MKPILFLIIFIFIKINSFSQNVAVDKFEDSILQVIKKTSKQQDVAEMYFKLAKNYLAKNPTKELLYLNKAIFEAEQTRDRQVIVNAGIKFIDQFIELGAQTERYEKASQMIEKMLPMAKESQLNKESTILLTRKAVLTRQKLEYIEALKLNEEALNYAQMSDNDSIKVSAELSYATTLMAKDELLGAFKKYMNALNVVEAMEDDLLKIRVYKSIGDFYVRVKQNEKAKDYYQKIINTAKKIKEIDYELQGYQSLIQLNSTLKDFAAARQYLEIFKQKITTSKNKLIQSNALYLELQILFDEDESKVGAYIRNNPKIINNMREMGMGIEADQGVAIMHSVEKNIDSAEYYFSKAKKAINPNDKSSIISFYNSYAWHLQRIGKNKDAIALYEQNLQAAVTAGSITGQKVYCEALDSLYLKTGNKQMEVSNKLVLYKLKDSLDKQQRANDLLNIEIDAENKRTERENKIKAEKLTKRHNLQYMGITAAIMGLFVLLAALGRLKVKPWLIRGLGFLSFILLFEFIILLADQQIHHLTHGEPLPILLIKIVLIAILLPFHHWVEHKAIHYLLRHQHKEILPAKESVT